VTSSRRSPSSGRSGWYGRFADDDANRHPNLLGELRGSPTVSANSEPTLPRGREGGGYCVLSATIGDCVRPARGSSCERLATRCLRHSRAVRTRLQLGGG
jgi:hypothetical protein